MLQFGEKPGAEQVLETELPSRPERASVRAWDMTAGQRGDLERAMSNPLLTCEVQP